MIINSNTVAANLLPATSPVRGKSSSHNRAASVGADQAPADSVSSQNLTAAGAPITDDDTASETTESMRQMIIAQNSMALMAQANSLPTSALRLLQQ